MQSEMEAPRLIARGAVTSDAYIKAQLVLMQAADSAACINGKPPGVTHAYLLRI